MFDTGKGKGELKFRFEVRCVSDRRRYARVSSARLVSVISDPVKLYVKVIFFGGVIKHAIRESTHLPTAKARNYMQVLE